MKVVPETSMVGAIAEDTAKRVTRRAILAFQRMTDCLGSGECSGLKNVWEEICVQVQFEHSMMWETYEEAARALLAGEVELPKRYEREAIWLQSEQGQDWECEYETDREPNPVFNDDIVQYLWQECLLQEAGRWSNARIRAYLARATATD